MAADDDGFDPEDYEGVNPKMANVPRSQVRKWEKQGRQIDELQAQLAQAERERTFAQAGLPDSTLAKRWAKGYDGPADTESIRAAAIQDGLIQPAAGQQEQIDQALEGHQIAAQAAAGAQAGQAGQVDHNAEMRRIASQFSGPGSAEQGRAALAAYAQQHMPEAADLSKQQGGR